MSASPSPSGVDPNGDPVLAARLAVPSLRGEVVRRSRLTELITTCNRDGVIAVVSGPPGSGKTCEVAVWARGGHASGPVVWLTLDEEANAPGVFWAYVIEGLRRARVVDLGTPGRAEGVDRSFLVRLAAELGSLDRPVTVVLDQFERIRTREVGSGLDFVVRHAGRQLRLVVVTRTEAVLPLYRYRLAGEIAEVTADDLAFNRAEAEEMLAPYLSGPSVDLLLARTEGWAAGLRLCTLALRRTDNPERLVRDLAVGHGPIADFLISEVLEAQPPETQDLLLRTSVLDRVQPDLANALTGRDDAARLLAELAGTHAFVDLIDEAGSWYRYHPLFAEVLLAQLRRRRPALEREMRLCAARWLADHDRLADGVAQAVRAGDWEFAADEMVDQLAVGRLLSGLETNRFARLFADLPAERPSPAVALVAAALAVQRLDVERCDRELKYAEDLADQAPPDRQPALNMGLSMLRIVVSRLRGDVEAAQSASAAARTVLPALRPRQVSTHPELTALMLSSLGTVELWSGRFHAATQTLTDAVNASKVTGGEYPLNNALGQLAMLEHAQGRLRLAETYARQAVEVIERSGMPLEKATGTGYAALAAIALDRGQIADARINVEKAGATVGVRVDPLTRVEVALARSGLCRGVRNWRSALATVGAAIDWTRDRAAPAWVLNRLYTEAALAYLGSGDMPAAVAGARQLNDDVERQLMLARIRLAAGQHEPVAAALHRIDHSEIRVPVLIQLRLIEAQTAMLRGSPGGATRAVHEAFVLAQPEGLRRPFQESGPWLRHLLRTQSGLEPIARWLLGERVAKPRRTPTSQETDAPLEPISDREREVLGLLSQMMTTEEIAGAMHLSVNTVKTHLKSIYRKLATSRRNEAVRRARQFKLI
ncbi:MAG TPA: LuxR C-terminal-related transcriptional regulator [Micromonosporaceae bacterium]